MDLAGMATAVTSTVKKMSLLSLILTHLVLSHTCQPCLERQGAEICSYMTVFIRIIFLAWYCYQYFSSITGYLVPGIRYWYIVHGTRINYLLLLSCRQSADLVCRTFGTPVFIVASFCHLHVFWLMHVYLTSVDIQVDCCCCSFLPVENCSFKLCSIAQLMRLIFLKFLYLLDKLAWSNNL